MLAAFVLFFIARGTPGFSIAQSGLAANGYGAHFPGGYSLAAGLLTEALLTAVFLIVILSVTRPGAPASSAPVAIGFTLTLIHLIAIPVTNVSVNPARSTGPALLQGGWALTQLWAFWLAPLGGALLGALVWLALTYEGKAKVPRRTEQPA